MSAGAYLDENGRWRIPLSAADEAPESIAGETLEDLIPLSEYARLHDRSKQRAFELKDQGRLDALGVCLTPLGWMIPKDAPWPAGKAGRPRKESGEKRDEGAESGEEGSGLSVQEYARRHNRSAATVYSMLREGRVEGARYMASGWRIPEDAPWPPLKKASPPPGAIADARRRRREKG